MGRRAFAVAVDQVTVFIANSGVVAWVELSVPGCTRRERLPEPMAAAPGDTVRVYIDPAALAAPAPTPDAIAAAVGELVAMAAALDVSESSPAAPTSTS